VSIGYGEIHFCCIGHISLNPQGGGQHFGVKVTSPTAFQNQGCNGYEQVTDHSPTTNCFPSNPDFGKQSVVKAV
jgi:hypothetical protein